jgi:hypothetical protein
MNVIFLAILFYLLYRFITGFLIPVFRTTRHVRERFSQMKGQQMNNPPGADANRQAGGPGTSTQNTGHDQSRRNRRPNTSKVGEYIDFEDVKK